MSSPYWTTDGRAIVYVITRAETSSLWSQWLDGGAPKQLADFSPEQIFSVGLSRDGKWLPFARGTIIRDVILITDTNKRDCDPRPTFRADTFFGGLQRASTGWRCLY